MRKVFILPIFSLLTMGTALVSPCCALSQDLIVGNRSKFDTQNDDSLFNTAPSPDRKNRVHFTLGYEFWSGNRFESIKIIDSPSLLGELGAADVPNLESSVYYEVAFTFPKLKLGSFPVTLGAGIQQLQYEYGGFVDVDQTVSGWLTETYYGEYVVHTTDLRSYSLNGSLNLKPYKPRHLFGYSARVFGSIRYFDINETERLTMQGNYHVNGTSGQLEYQTENFNRSIPADKIAIEAGGRLELHATRFLSVILPQVTLRGTVFRKTIPAVVYSSSIDDDRIELPQRKSSYTGIFVMIGIQLHM